MTEMTGKPGRAGALADVLPEQFEYRDEGCEESPSCLQCPLPRCKHDDPGWLRRERLKERNREVLTALQQEGLSVHEVALRFRLSRRTIFRILSRDGD